MEQFKEIAELMANEKKELNTKFAKIETNLKVPEIEFSKEGEHQTLGGLIKFNMENILEKHEELKEKMSEERAKNSHRFSSLHNDM